MSAAIYNLSIEKGVDFALRMDIQRANGTYVDLTDTGVYLKADIVEFYGLDPITGFTMTEVLPSGVILSLNEAGTKSLPYENCFYDVVLNDNGATERLVQGTIDTSEGATLNLTCP